MRETVDRGQILEVLHLALKRLENPRTTFDFNDWTSCTCGHIYAATKGRRATGILAVYTASDERYAAVIMGVARALGWDGTVTVGLGWDGTMARAATEFVSNATSDVARDENLDPTRSHAIAVVKQAIAEIEAMQERDRLDVLAQARAVVDAVAVAPERVPVA